MDPEEPIRIEINGVLDLHSFNPKDLSTLIDEYIDACLEKKICKLESFMVKGSGISGEVYIHFLKETRM